MNQKMNTKYRIKSLSANPGSIKKETKNMK